MVVAMPGIDISNNNGSVDLNQVANSGKKFVAIKATEGDFFRDSYFPDNWRNAKAYGLVRMAYHFARPSSASAEKEAYFFLDYVQEQGIEEGDLLCLDMEDEKFSGDVVPWTKFFLELIESVVGFNSILYSGPWYIRSRMPDPTVLSAYELWNAQYPLTIVNTSTPPPTAPYPWLNSYRLWQYSSAGRVPGVNGDCDLNNFYGTVEDLRKMGKPATSPAPSPSPDLEQIKSGLLTLQGNNESYVNELNNIIGKLKDDNAAIEYMLKLLE